MTYKEISVEVMDCRCLQCGNIFEDIKLSDFQYGEKLLQLEDRSQYVYMNILDVVSKEVSIILHQNIADEYNLSFYFEKVIGITCDSINGKRVLGYLKWQCSVCGSNDVSVIGYQPIKTKIIVIPIAEHTHWVSLPISERREMILKAISDCF